MFYVTIYSEGGLTLLSNDLCCVLSRLSPDVCVWGREGSSDINCNGVVREPLYFLI